MAASTTTVPLGNRVDVNLKREFDSTAEDLGLTPTVAITVFMKRFVQDGGFPFDVCKPTPSKSEFIAQMEDRYERMLDGHEAEHDLIEE